MTITPEDVDEIANRIVVNTMAKAFADKQMPYEMGLKLGILQKSLIDNLIFAFKAKMKVLPGQENEVKPAHGDIPPADSINPLDRFGSSVLEELVVTPEDPQIGDSPYGDRSGV